MHTPHRALALSVLCSMFLLPQVAQAQESEETIRLNQEATEAFQAGAFEKAATKFTEAAQKSTTKRSSAVLIKNAMIAWYKVPQCVNAVSSARVFLGYTKVATLSDSDVSDAKTVIVKCRAKDAQAALEADDLPLAEAAIKDVKFYTVDPNASTELKLLNDAYARKKQAADDAERARLRKEIQDDAFPLRLVIGGTMAGAGVAGLIVTGVHVMNKKDEFGYEEGTDDEDATIVSCEDVEPEDKKNCLEFANGTLRNKLILGYTLSGLSLAGGAALVILDLMDDGESDPNALKIYPVVGAGQAGAGLRFNF